jgi:hypothetical protein
MTLQEDTIPDTQIIGAYNGNAGKDYPCDVCGKTIHKGERYTRLSYKEAGQFKCHHYHYVCS